MASLDEKSKNIGILPRVFTDVRQESLAVIFSSLKTYLSLIAERNLPDDVRAKVAPSDIIQETYLEAERHYRHFKGNSERELIAWLQQILLNNVRDASRRYEERQKRQVCREVPLDQFNATECADRGESPSRLAAANEEALKLHQALAQLPKDYRQVLILRSLERRSLREVSEIMERTEEAVRKLWSRALVQLQQILNPVNPSGN